jgi:gamma-glutamyltranspeptidase/glutathione hydrolase
MRAAVAAGHPATAGAGLEILAEGGTAADAAVAACLASCVAETVMTGLLGGGHAVYHDAETAVTANLDCFVAVPGLGPARPAAPLVRLAVPFGEELVHYAVGIASFAVPGVPAGLGALWERFGSLPWQRLCEPALALARDGVAMPAAHASCLAMLAPVMTLNEGTRIYAPGGSLLREGELLRQPGLVRALETLRDEGPSSAYRGSLAASLLELMARDGGLVTKEDFHAYRPRWLDPVAVERNGISFATRDGISGLRAALLRLRPLAGLSAADRAVRLVRALARHQPGGGHTTNLVTVDPAGSACVLTSSLGLGSGDWLPGYDLHLNSMLGEVDLLVGPLGAGQRMESMMAPLLAFRDGDLVLAAGAAGGTRLRGALVQVVAGVLDEQLEPAAAVARPRLHPAGGIVHLEPGFERDVDAALGRDGWRVSHWRDLHHYFGGVSLVGEAGAAGDPRRSGDAATLED